MILSTRSIFSQDVSGRGAGTVTRVSVVSANGFSGTVATDTTTPAITIIAGAITPSSVASSGAISVLDSPGARINIGTSNDLQLYHDGSSSYIQNTTGDLIFYNDSTTDTTRFFNGPTERLTILANGNVGVGTTAPGEKLDVVGIVRGSSSVITGTATVATLPTATIAARHFVTDATMSTTLGIGTIVAGGGANNVAVYADGTNWRIG